jgi:hypothetical protein
MAALALGIPTNWLTELGSQPLAGCSTLIAAEPLPADDPAAAPEDESSDEQTGEKPAGVSKNKAVPIEYFPRPTTYEAKIIETLDKPTRIEVSDIPLEKCIDYLKDHHKINIWIDRAALSANAAALDQRVTLKLAGVTLRSVLKLLLEPMQMSYVIEDGVMKITTCAMADKRLITRTYPVHDLYRGRVVADDQPRDQKGAPTRSPSESRPGDLETAIVKTIEPESWDDKKGPGSMTYVEEAGSLVIRQTASAHEQILQLLRDLRVAKRAVHGAPAEQAAPQAGWKLRGRKRAETYSIVGIIDLDGDGKDDSRRLHRLINAIGADFDNEINEKGNLLINGQIPDPYKPEITEKTKFVILGTIPQFADLSDPDEIATSLKIAGLYKDLEDQARARGVRIVALSDFLRYIGYEPSRRE